MEELRTRTVQGHLVFERGGEIVLLDTGSPMTVRRGGIVDLDEISGNVGERIDVLMGMDSFGAIAIDMRTSRVWLYSNEEAQNDNLLPMPMRDVFESVMGVPAIRVKVNGMPARMFLDTGAVTGYVNRRYLGNGSPVRRVRDFYPTQGTFDVDVYDAHVEVGAEETGVSIRMELGVLPPALSMLGLLGCDGILGRAFFEQHCVLINSVRRYWGYVGI